MHRNASGGQLTSTTMATGESLKKLNVATLKSLCADLQLSYDRKIKKEELVSLLLNHQVPVDVLTPVLSRASCLEGATPTVTEVDVNDLPPFNKILYAHVSVDELPSPSFVSIYIFMIERSRQSSEDRVQNFKGLDRAVRHFDAGDVQDIQLAKVY